MNAGGADQVADGYDFEATSNEYMTVTDAGDDYDFGANEPFTIVVWFKCRNTATHKWIIDKYITSQGWYLGVLSSGELYFGIKSGGAGLLTITSDNQYDDNAWHMVAIRRVAGDTTIKMWVDDGVAEDKSGVGYSGDLGNNSVLAIGRYTATTSLYFDGVMGDGGGASRGILIYDTELSDVDLGALYAAEGWTGDFNGFVNPAELNGYVKAEVQEANGYEGMS